MSNGMQPAIDPAQDWLDVLTCLRERCGGTSMYRYHDGDDAISDGVRGQPKSGEELALWHSIMDRIRGPGPRRGRALDAGCGLGEYLPLLRQRFVEVLGVDADASRVAQARRCLTAANTSVDSGRTNPSKPCRGSAPARDGQSESGGELELFVSGLEGPVWREPALTRRFDFVQCIQVLGHVPLAAAPAILENLAGLLRGDGHLLIAIPFSSRAEDEFVVCEAGADGAVHTERVDAAAYDELARSPVAGRLAVRHFSLASVARAMAAAHLTVVARQPYHWLTDERGDLFVLASV